jgi:DNA-binding transcriptional MerR regulator
MRAVPPDSETSIDGRYRIATVSNLTGIPVQTIRVWESRYSAVQPTRSAGNVRLYTRADIERLIILKAAVDAGHAISTVAALTDRQIKARFKGAPVAVAKTRESGCRTLVCGEALALLLQSAWRSRSDVRIQSILPSLADIDFGAMDEVDAVIVDAPLLSRMLPLTLQRLRAATKASVAIVIYTLSDRQVLASLDNANVIALAAPTDPAQIARICQLGLLVAPVVPDAFSQMLMHSAAPRRFDDAFLYQLSHMPSKVQCECPNHMADLLNKLNAFERYSLECESTDSADASLHAMLYSASSHCRAIFEEVLGRLLVHEGKPVEGTS